MSLSGQLFDIMFDAAHILKVVSYTFVLVGLLVSVYEGFQRAEDSAAILAHSNNALQKEVRERQHVQAVLAAKAAHVEMLQAVTVAAYESASVDDAMLRCVTRICQCTGWPVGHVYRQATDDSGLLIPTEMWYFQDLSKFETFKAVTERTAFLPVEGVRIIDHATYLATKTTLKKYQERVRALSTELTCRVLLAEDGPDNQRLISFVLKKAGAEVTVVDDGQQAYDEAIKAQREGTTYDVILMDMQMPVLDGYDAMTKLREDGYTHPIIAITAHAMASDCQKCLDAGADEYTTKPLDRRKLIDLVYQLSQQDAPADPVSTL